MASFSSTPLQQRQLSSLFPCKFRFNLFPSEFFFTAHSLTPLAKNAPSFVSRPRNRPPYLAKLSTTDQNSTKNSNSAAKKNSNSGLPSLGKDRAQNGTKGSSVRQKRELGTAKSGSKGAKSLNNVRNLEGVEIVDSKSAKNLGSSSVKDRTQKGSSLNGSLRQKRETSTAKSDTKGMKSSNNVGNFGGGSSNSAKKTKKNKTDSPELPLRVKLEQCSKRGDFMEAIELYDWARKDGILLSQYHYTILLYLCSSAAVGIVQPAKSGSGNRSLKSLELVPKDSSDTSMESYADIGSQNPNEMSSSFGDSLQEGQVIRLSEDSKQYALKRGFEIYEQMISQDIPMNEATLTSVAKMALSVGDGDKAFDMVKQMNSLGINPRLRSYGPALSAFCSKGDVEKAFEVEKHMLDQGVYPEEPELQLLLKLSIAASKGDKVYYLLHKLRSTVRKVSPFTADLIQKWFTSGTASKVGKKKLDKNILKEAMRNGGGGWHGQGWLGKGKWNVSNTTVGADGFCTCCGEKLALIDLDAVETEKFAESVAAIAMKSKRESSFQKFQKWLDYYGPFEAVIDAANVGLYGQRRFLPARINAVVNAIRQELPSRRWPLIVLHNRRITGVNKDQPINRALVDKWKNADALYSTPTGSNDDWYWLYAAIKFKCLLVTNDEMRDHTFQLLGNDFFPKWKERHQVHFSFGDTGLVFHMPPACSIVIQESEIGHWHIPILSGDDEYEADRTWLCVTRANSGVTANTRDAKNTSPPEPNKTRQNLRDIFAASVSSRHSTILPELEDAESDGNCVLDFEI